MFPTRSAAKKGQMRLKLLKKSLSHEQIFVERYQRMKVWARQLAEHDHELAEDLLHDAFVQFTLAQPDLDTIHNLDGYLYGILRNLRLSHIRRETRNRLTQLSVVEYDSAADGLEAIDWRDQFQAKDEIRRICAFACERKEAARTASVLILRFFHGYFPSEIAQVIRTSRAAVDVRLLTARNEVKAFLEDPAGVTFLGVHNPPADPGSVAALTADQFLMELRRQVFKSRRGEHPSKQQFEEFYRDEKVSPMDVKQLAHLVSCASCLDEVNEMLNLPKLVTRFATDTIGRDKRKKGGSDDIPPTNGGSSDDDDELARLRYRTRRVFEHKPKELSVSVNGSVQGSLMVNSDLNELTLNFTHNEQVSFVEIFSEQQVRLLMLNIDEMPPHSSPHHAVSLQLSNGRSLAAELNFAAHGASLRLEYRDPTFEEVKAILADRSLLDRPSQPVHTANLAVVEGGSRDHEWARSRVNRISGFINGWQNLFLTRRRLVYGLSMATLAIVLMGAIAFISVPTTGTVSAAELLDKSAAAEAVAERNAVVHRTMRITTRFPAKQAAEYATVSYSIEIWRDAARQISVKRVTDANGNLVVWQRVDKSGSRSYYPKAFAQVKLTPALPVKIGKKVQQIWELDLTAKDYRELISNAETTNVDEKPETYVIDYAGSNDGLERATLTLDRNDLRPVAQTLVVSSGGIRYEYSFEATAFQRLNSADVADSVFEPQPGLNEVPPAKSEQKNIGTSAVAR